MSSNHQNLIWLAKSIISVPAIVSATGLSAIFGASVSACAIPALSFGAGALYVYNTKHDNFNIKHVKMAFGMAMQLQQSYSSIKLCSNLIGAANSIWNGKYKFTDLMDNIDLHNTLKVVGFGLNGISTINSVKNSLSTLGVLFGEDYILSLVSDKIPCLDQIMPILKYLNFDPMKIMAESSANSAIAGFDNMFGGALSYVNPSELFVEITTENNLSISSKIIYVDGLQESIQGIVSAIGKSFDGLPMNDWVML